MRDRIDLFFEYRDFLKGNSKLNNSSTHQMIFTAVCEYIAETDCVAVVLRATSELANQTIKLVIPCSDTAQLSAFFEAWGEDRSAKITLNNRNRTILTTDGSGWITITESDCCGDDNVMIYYQDAIDALEKVEDFMKRSNM